ncbi:hypothetical protein ACFL0Q_01360 [Thermodesulfobacteriota bacterium]
MRFLLLGGPGETRASVLESLTFIDSLPLDAVKLTLGIRIYPSTQLARLARQSKMIRSEDDLLIPAFYMNPELADWIREAVDARAAKRPRWIIS